MEHLTFLCFKDIRENILLYASVYRRLYRLLSYQAGLYIRLNLRYKFGILPQAMALIQKFAVMSPVNIDHPTCTFKTSAAPSHGKRI